MLKSHRIVSCLGASLLALVAAGVAAGWSTTAYAATQPRLGTAANFAVLAGTTITNTGPTVITGDLGLHPGTSATGFPPGTVTGTPHITDGAALQAKNDLITAYTDAATATSTSDLSGQDLGGKNLIPGVYTFSSSAQLTGPLTLSGNGVFIFQVGSALTTATNSAVLLVNGAQACAVFWQVTSSATLGTGTQFQGNLMALSDITMVTGANILTGRAMARNGALTLDTNRITPPTGACTVAAATPTTAPTATPSPTTSTTVTTATPTTSTTTPPSTPSTGSGMLASALPGVGAVAIIVGILGVAVGRRRSDDPL
jgi:hypothetical protein